MKKILLVFILLLAMLSVAALPMQRCDTKPISAKSLGGYECNDSEWHFVINQIDTEEHAPDSIYVTWENGAEEDVPLDKFTGGVAHYVTYSNLDSNVISATTDIYEGWEGEFNLSHGPCDPPTPTPTTPVPTDTPEATPTDTPEITPTNTPEVTPTPGTETPTPDVTETPWTPTPTNTQQKYTPTPKDPAAGGSGPTITFEQMGIIAGIGILAAVGFVLVPKLKLPMKG